MLKDVSDRKSEDVGWSMIVKGNRVSKCDECKKKKPPDPSVSWLHVTACNRSDIASRLGEGPGRSWGRGCKKDGPMGVSG